MRRAWIVLALLALALPGRLSAAQDALAAAIQASAGVTGSGEAMRLHLSGREVQLGEEVEGWRLVALSATAAIFMRDGQLRSAPFAPASYASPPASQPSRVVVAGSLDELMADYQGRVISEAGLGFRHAGAVMMPGDATPGGWKLVSVLQGGVVFTRNGVIQSYAFDAAGRPSRALPPGQIPQPAGRDLLPLTPVPFPAGMDGLDGFARYAYYRKATIDLGEENKSVNGPASVNGPSLLPNEALIAAIGADAYIDYTKLLQAYRPPDPKPQAFVPVEGGPQVLAVVDPENGRIAWLDRRDPGPIAGTYILRPDKVVNATADELGLIPVEGYQFIQLNSADIETGPDGQPRLKTPPRPLP